MQDGSNAVYKELMANDRAAKEVCFLGQLLTGPEAAD